ncbi:hypothetical protein PG985_003724 [Apiospora marii]|uniref:Uncharacterized protein n=1 Tax=Apiospora marii TaxID=335849 RepID=A0ABR1SHA0_9PEZI
MKNIKMLVTTLATGLAVAGAVVPSPTVPGFIGYAVDDTGLDAVDRHILPTAATIVSEPPVVAGQAGGPGGHHQVGFNLQQQNESTLITTVTTTGTLTLTLASGQVTTIEGPYAVKSQVVVTESDTTVGGMATVTVTTSMPSMTDAGYGTSSSSASSDASATATTASASAPSSSDDATATTSSDGDTSSTPDATSSDPAQSASPTSADQNAASNCTAMNLLQKFIIFYGIYNFWDMEFFARLF